MLRRFCLASGLAYVLLVWPASAQTPGSPPGGTPGGGIKFEFPQPGQVLSNFTQDQLKLSAEQKKQVSELQKEVDAKIGDILSPEQKKSLANMRLGKGGFGPPGKGGFGAPGKGGFGPPPGFGGFGGTGADDVKKQIGATDEEWKVIGPKLQKVVAARRVLASDSRTTDVLGGFARLQGAFDSGPAKKPGAEEPNKKPQPEEAPLPKGAIPAGAAPGAGATPGDSPRPGGIVFGGPMGMGANIITQAQADLKSVLDDPKHNKSEVEEKIAAVRKARQKARTDLEAAQRDLVLLLTPSQEAILFNLGYLE